MFPSADAGVHFPRSGGRGKPGEPLQCSAHQLARSLCLSCFCSRAARGFPLCACPRDPKSLWLPRRAGSETIQRPGSSGAHGEHLLGPEERQSSAWLKNTERAPQHPSSSWHPSQPPTLPSSSSGVVLKTTDQGLGGRRVPLACASTCTRTHNPVVLLGSLCNTTGSLFFTCRSHPSVSAATERRAP